MKPAARAQGKGIFLFRKLQDITAWRRVRKSIRIQLRRQHSFRL